MIDCKSCYGPSRSYSVWTASTSVAIVSTDDRVTSLYVFLDLSMRYLPQRLIMMDWDIHLVISWTWTRYLICPASNNLFSYTRFKKNWVSSLRFCRLTYFVTTSVDSRQAQCLIDSVRLSSSVPATIFTCKRSQSIRITRYDSTARSPSEKLLLNQARHELSRQFVLFCQYHEIVVLMKQSDVLERAYLFTRIEIIIFEFHDHGQHQ